MLGIWLNIFCWNAPPSYWSVLALPMNLIRKKSSTLTLVGMQRWNVHIWWNNFHNKSCVSYEPSDTDFHIVVCYYRYLILIDFSVIQILSLFNFRSLIQPDIEEWPNFIHISLFIINVVLCQFAPTTNKSLNIDTIYINLIM